MMRSWDSYIIIDHRFKGSLVTCGLDSYSFQERPLRQYSSCLRDRLDESEKKIGPPILYFIAEKMKLLPDFFSIWHHLDTINQPVVSVVSLDWTLLPLLAPVATGEI